MIDEDERRVLGGQGLVGANLIGHGIILSSCISDFRKEEARRGARRPPQPPPESGPLSLFVPFVVPYVSPIGFSVAQNDIDRALVLLCVDSASAPPVRSELSKRWRPSLSSQPVQ